VILILAYIIIKFGLGRNYRRVSRNIKVLDQISLSPKVTLTVVKIGKEIYLIGTTDNNLVMLKELKEYPEEEIEENAINFADILKTIKQRKQPK